MLPFCLLLVHCPADLVLVSVTNRRLCSTAPLAARIPRRVTLRWLLASRCRHWRTRGHARRCLSPSASVPVWVSVPPRFHPIWYPAPPPSEARPSPRGTPEVLARHRVRTEYNAILGLSPGFVLARAMTTCMATVFCLRRRCLQATIDFASRSRDHGWCRRRLLHAHC